MEEADLVEALYDGIGDDAALADALSGLAGAIGGHAWVYFHNGPAGVHDALDLGIDPEVWRSYARHYQEQDPFKAALVSRGELRARHLFSGNGLVGADRLRRSPFVQELLRPGDLGCMLGHVGAVTGSRSAHLAIYRPWAAGDFSAAERSLVRRLEPHLARLARLRLRLGGTGGTLPAWTGALLDSVSWGVALLDEDGRPRILNAPLEATLAVRDGLYLDRQGFYAARSDDSRRLATAIARAARGCGPERRLEATDLRLPRPSGRPSWLVAVLPLAARHRGTAAPPAAAVLHVLHPEGMAADPDLARPRRMFGLTPAEARLARELAAGHRLEEIAQRHGLAVSTLKTQLRQVFAKTGTARQSELVALLARISLLAVERRK